MVNEIFTSTAAHAILTIPIPVAPRQNRLIWLLDSKGIFSVKSVHKVSFSQSNGDVQPKVHWKKLWKARFPERLKMLIWRIGINAIPTRANLQRRLQHVDLTCILCNSGNETSIHLFFECHFARTLWSSACWGFRIDASLLNSNEDIIKLIMASPNSPMPIREQWTISLNMAIIIDKIWKTRNLMLF